MPAGRMPRISARAGMAAIVVATLAIGTGCGGPSVRADAALYGEIVFHDTSQRGDGGFRYESVRAGEVNAVDSPDFNPFEAVDPQDAPGVVSATGKRGVWRPGESLEGELEKPEKKKRHSFGAMRPVRLSSEDFALLWSRLADIGALDLSSPVTGPPPGDVSYLYFRDATSQSQRILIDPRARPGSPGEALLAWSRAKALLATGSYDTGFQWVRRED